MKKCSYEGRAGPALLKENLHDQERRFYKSGEYYPQPDGTNWNSLRGTGGQQIKQHN